MKALREVRPPGVYSVGFESRINPLTVADCHVAGFLGLANKGPLDTPHLLRNWAEFVEVYGATSEGYLARSVEGFFQNGGRSCYVVRVARRPEPGQLPGPEHAACAERVLKNTWDADSLRVTALNEGRWGNNVWVRCERSTGAKTLLTLDLEVGAGAARVNATRGIERGALVRIHDRENSDFVIITEIDDKTLRWSTQTPILRAYAAAGPTYIEVLEFEVYASLKDRREVFKNLQLSPLSRRYAPRVINDQSTLIRLADLQLQVTQSTSSLPDRMPAPGPPEKLKNGRDGTDGMIAEDFVGHDHGVDDRIGLMTLMHVEEVGLLLVPDAMLAYSRMTPPEARNFVQRVQDVMVDICENTQDRFAILDLPQTRDIEEVRRLRHHRDSQFSAYYFPWLEVTAADGSLVQLPPSGHVAGVYARCDLAHGVHKAPANETLQGLAQLTLPLSDDHIGQLNTEGVNTLRAFTGRGIRIWGARTTSSDPDWRYINVRRLFVMLRRAITNGMQWVSFEPNTPDTWSVLEREISLFLRDLWMKGYFAGGSAEESFIVKCDRETNPPESVDAGRLVTQIRVAPALPAEYILFSIEQLTGGLATEATQTT